MKRTNIIVALSLVCGILVNVFSPFENITLNADESKEKIAEDVMELMNDKGMIKI